MIIKQPGSLAIIKALLLISFIVPAHAGQPVVWETSGRTELLKGDSRGVSISDTGLLMLAVSWTAAYFLWRRDRLPRRLAFVMVPMGLSGWVAVLAGWIYLARLLPAEGRWAKLMATAVGVGAGIGLWAVIGPWLLP